jgi:ubiquinone/menaquinone biosynthesis C-methylase UbiE
VDHPELTPPYVRYLVRLVRPFPNFDFFFIRALRQRAVRVLQLKPGSRVLDVGCGPGGSFPYLVEAVGASGEVVGVEISPEAAINANRRVEANGWSNVRVVEADARTVQLTGSFDGMMLFGAPDVYASPQALTNLLPYLKVDARIVAFGAKLSDRRTGAVLNWLFRTLMKLSFSSTPGLNHEPWSVLEDRMAEVEVQEYLLGCMFIAWGAVRSSTNTVGKSPPLR